MLTQRAGAIYSVLLFLLIGLYAGGSPGMFVVLDLVRIIPTNYPPRSDSFLMPPHISSHPSS